MADPPSYSQRPTPLGPPLELTLESDALVAAHRRRLRVPLGEIEAMRLTFAPTNLMSRSFRCRLATKAGRSIAFSSQSWKSIAEPLGQAEAYAAFVRALAPAVAAANPRCRFIAGRGRWAWLALAAVSLGVAAGLAAALAVLLRGASWPGALVAATAFGAMAWTAKDMVIRNRPRRFAPDAPPDDLLG